jgi:glycine amidinotransferase/scyllo-inosamine-4-phosphate amidinotransferase 1
MVNVKNEYGKLKEVIVGRVDNANQPVHGTDLHAINYADKDKIPFSERGLFDPQVYEESIEDLDLLASALEDFGAKVHRPNILNTKKTISNGYWETDQYYTFCPRDTMTVIGNTLIESPMTLRSRQFETDAYRELFIDYNDKGSKWICAPKPRLTDNSYQRDNLDDLTLTNVEPVFDAANILRHNDDILYLNSNTGNKKGFTWLKNILGDKYTVHYLQDMYSYSHLDSTISILRDGLALVNPARVNEKNMPSLFKGWDIIYSPPMVDIGYTGVLRGSEWIGINLISLDENTVCVDNRQTELIKVLKKYKIEALDLKIRHSRTLGGSFHCCTNDMIRE